MKQVHCGHNCFLRRRTLFYIVNQNPTEIFVESGESRVPHFQKSLLERGLVRIRRRTSVFTPKSD